MKQTIWCRAFRGNKAVGNATGQCESFDINQIQNGVRKICAELDISQPVWLNKHQNDIENFHRTVFKPGDFIEPVVFDRFEIEVYEEQVFFKK